MHDCIRGKYGLTGNGYGHAKLNGREVSAHRLAYMLVHGPIPDGLVIMHLCNNKWCVNVDHMRIGTNADNANHAKLTGALATPNQHQGRNNTEGRVLPKGITIRSTGRQAGQFACNIRSNGKRYQANKLTLEEAIAWRQEMEIKLWGDPSGKKPTTSSSTITG